MEILVLSVRGFQGLGVYLLTPPEAGSLQVDVPPDNLHLTSVAVPDGSSGRSSPNRRRRDSKEVKCKLSGGHINLKRSLLGRRHVNRRPDLGTHDERTRISIPTRMMANAMRGPPPPGNI